MGGVVVMHKLKKIYVSNPIVQFWASYIFVLIIPLLLLTVGFQLAFDEVEENINASSVTMLSHSKSIIEGELTSIRTLAFQTSQDNALESLGKKDKKDTSYFLTAKRVINDYYTLLGYQSAKLLNVDKSYIYLPRTEAIIYDNTMYNVDIFKKVYFKKWDIESKAWIEMSRPENLSTPKYTVLNGHLLYCMPLATSFSEDNAGFIAYEIDTSQLEQFLDFGNEYDEYSMFVLNEHNEVLWQKDQLGWQEELGKDSIQESLSHQGTGYLDYEDVRVIYTTAEQSAWKYVLVMPEKTVFSELNHLKVLIGGLIIGAMALGVLLSLMNAIHKGRPINELFKFFTYNDESPKDSKKLGELVAEVVRNNEELIEELEDDKPILQKGFFHDLIKAEFVNSTEIAYRAEKAGIDLKGQVYKAVSFRVFSNNDFYETDEQTMEEVRILSQVIMKYIVTHTEDAVWFYKRDYLTMNAIFGIKADNGQIEQLAQNTHEWIYKEYAVDSNWGISNGCTNLLEIWKICEESSIALNGCKGKRHITQYTTELVDAKTFYLPHLLEERIANCIRSGDNKSLQELLNILEEENINNRQIGRKMLIKLNTKLTQLMAQVAQEGVDITEWVYELNDKVLNFAGDLGEYFNKLEAIYMDLCREMNKKKSVHRKEMIDTIIEYIQMHYMESDLGLSKIATLFDISEGYVSSIFKGQTGINFADYIENIRIEKACTLLSNKTIAISEVAEQVGYNSVHSFRRAFKRVKEVNPKDYRNLNS